MGTPDRALNSVSLDCDDALQENYEEARRVFCLAQAVSCPTSRRRRSASLISSCHCEWERNWRRKPSQSSSHCRESWRGIAEETPTGAWVITFIRAVENHRRRDTSAYHRARELAFHRFFSVDNFGASCLWYWLSSSVRLEPRFPRPEHWFLRRIDSCWSFSFRSGQRCSRL